MFWRIYETTSLLENYEVLLCSNSCELCSYCVVNYQIIFFLLVLLIFCHYFGFSKPHPAAKYLKPDFV